MQGGQSCCFHQAVAALPFSYNFMWLAPPPARWGNSVLNTAFCPTRSALGPTTYPTLGGWLISPLLLSAFVSLPASAGWGLLWAVGLSLHSCSHLCSLRVLLLPPPHSPGQVQPYTPTSTVSVKLQFAVYAFQFCLVWGGFSLPRDCAGLCSQGVGRRVMCGV
jgi:hypothetical protein